MNDKLWYKVDKIEDLHIGDRIKYTIDDRAFGEDDNGRFVKSVEPFLIENERGVVKMKDFELLSDVHVFVPAHLVPKSLGGVNARQMDIMTGLRELVESAHGAAVEAGWWVDLTTGSAITTTQEVVGDKLMLIVTEVAEAKEGHRKDLMDDHLPHRKMVEVELADAVIRIADLAGALGLDLGAAVVEKMQYNKTRADHKIENRLKEGGKKS